jgi:hypothetical protein
MNEKMKPGADAPGSGTSRPSIKVDRHPINAPAAFNSHGKIGATPRHRQAEAVVDEDGPLPAREVVGDLVQFPPLPQEALVRIVLFAGRLAKRQGVMLPTSLTARLADSKSRGHLIAPVLEDWAIRKGVLPKPEHIQRSAQTCESDTGDAGHDE